MMNRETIIDYKNNQWKLEIKPEANNLILNIQNLNHYQKYESFFILNLLYVTKLFQLNDSIQKTVNLILSMYAKDMTYGIILDAKTAEHSARMNSMKSATDNAEEVIGKLQLLYNRARQNVVTTELIDIIGGANAIGGDK